jgi:hypothetical protein
MSKYSRNLLLPNIILDSEPLLEIKRAKLTKNYVCVLQDFQDLINPEVMYIFKQLNAVPNILIALGHENNINHKTPLIIHTDVFKRNSEWVKVPFAINTEITDTPVDFKWFDAPLIEVYPPDKDTDDIGYLSANGIHYGVRYQPGISTAPKECSLLDYITLNQNESVLVNTSIPHGVEYSQYNDRLNISFRFKFEDIPTWESALKHFKPLFK